MKKFVGMIPVAFMILLGGCTQVTPAQIQAATTQLCGFVPTAVVISSFIPQVGPFAATAGSVAQAICTALATQVPATQGGRRRLAGNVSLTVSVGGTTVQVVGHYK
jgi:hypothetical protein